MRTGSVSMMLLGKSYKHVPEPVPASFANRIRRTWSDEVVLFMRLAYAAPGVTATKIAEAHDGNLETILNILMGRTYKDVPGAIDKLKPQGPAAVLALNASAMERRLFAPEVALFIRLAYKPRVVSAARIARAFGTDPDSICRLLRGESYKEVPCALEALGTKGNDRLLTDEQVIQARRWFRSGLRSTPQIGKLFGMKQAATYNMIRGITYSDVPEAVPKRTVTRRMHPKIIKKRGVKTKRVLVPVRTVRLLDHDERIDHRTLMAAE
jgi:hypothetical protein